MAVPEFTFRVEGLSELERNLRQLGEEYGPRRARTAFRIPMRNAFRVVEAAIRSSTPVDTGDLQETTRLQVGVSNRFEKARNPGAVYSARAGWFWTPARSFWFQALAVEFGTSQVPARAVLRNALSNYGEAAANQLGRELGANIEKTARRLARQRARGVRRR